MFAAGVILVVNDADHSRIVLTNPFCLLRSLISPSLGYGTRRRHGRVSLLSDSGTEARRGSPQSPPGQALMGISGHTQNLLFGKGHAPIRWDARHKLKAGVGRAFTWHRALSQWQARPAVSKTDISKRTQSHKRTVLHGSAWRAPSRPPHYFDNSIRSISFIDPEPAWPYKLLRPEARRLPDADPKSFGEVSPADIRFVGFLACPIGSEVHRIVLKTKRC